MPQNPGYNTDELDRLFGPSAQTPVPSGDSGAGYNTAELDRIFNQKPKKAIEPGPAPQPKAPPATGVEPGLWDYLKNLPGEAWGQIKDVAAHPIDAITKPLVSTEPVIKKIGEMGGAFAQPQQAGEALFGKAPVPNSLSPGAVKGIAENTDFFTSPAGVASLAVGAPLAEAAPVASAIGGAVLGAQAGLGIPDLVEQRAAAQKKVELAKASGNIHEAQLAQAQVDQITTHIIASGVMVVGGALGAGKAMNEGVEGLAARRNARLNQPNVEAQAAADMNTAEQLGRTEYERTAPKVNVQSQFDAAEQAFAKSKKSTITPNRAPTPEPQAPPPPVEPQVPPTERPLTPEEQAAQATDQGAQSQLEPTPDSTRAIKRYIKRYDARPEPFQDPTEGDIIHPTTLVSVTESKDPTVQSVAPNATAPSVAMAPSAGGETVLPFGNEGDPAAAQAELDAIFGKARAEQPQANDVVPPQAERAPVTKQPPTAAPSLVAKEAERLKYTLMGQGMDEDHAAAVALSHFAKEAKGESVPAEIPGTEDILRAQHEMENRPAPVIPKPIEAPKSVETPSAEGAAPAIPSPAPKEPAAPHNTEELDRIFGAPQENVKPANAPSREHSLEDVANYYVDLYKKYSVNPTIDRQDPAYRVGMSDLTAKFPWLTLPDRVELQPLIDAKMKGIKAAEKKAKQQVPVWRPETRGSEQPQSFLSFRKDQLAKNPSLPAHAIRPLFEMSKGTPFEQATKHVAPEIKEAVRSAAGVEAPAEPAEGTRGRYPLAEERPGERGSISFKKRPAPKSPLPNSPEYQKIFDAQHKAPPSKLDKIIESLKTLPERFKNQLDRDLDMWIDFRKLEAKIKENTGMAVSPEESAYNRATLSWGGGMGSTEATFIEQALIDLKAQEAGLSEELRAYRNLKGNIRAIETAEAKLAAAKTPRDKRIWQDRLNQDKVAAGGYNRPKLERDLKALEQSLGPQKLAQVKGFAKEGFDLNRSALDAYHAEGMISNETYRSLVSRGDEYVNMHRIMDILDDEKLHTGSSMNMRAQHGVKALTGSERINKDPSVADPENRGIIYRDIEINKVPKALINLRHLDPNGVGQLFTQKGKLPGQRMSPHSDEGIVSFYEGGKKQEWIVPKVYADAIQAGASANSMQMFGAAAIGKSGKIFKSLYTSLNPAFVGPNLIKDTGGTLALTHADVVKYFEKMGKAANDYLTKNDDYLKFLRSGAAYAGMQHQIDPYVRLNDMMGHKDGVIVVKQLSELSAMVESLSKMASREEQLARGVNPITAAVNARQLAGNPDVSNAGQRLREANKILLFFASKAKDLERSARFAAKDPKYMLKLIGATIAAEVALEEYNRQYASLENPTKKEWDLVPDGDKNNYNTVLLPFEFETTQGERRLWAIKIPRQRFTGELLGANIAAAYAAALGRVGTEEAFLGAAKGHPFASAGGAAVSAMHPVLQVPMEQIANEETYSMTPIVPKSLESASPRLQYDERTSPSMIKLSRAVHATDEAIANLVSKVLPGLGSGLRDLPIESPKRLEHLMKTFGPPAEMLTSAADSLQRNPKTTPQGPERLARAPLVGPILRRFVLSAGNQQRRTQEENFYHILDRAETASKDIFRGFTSAQEREDTINKFMKDPERIVQAQMAPYLRKQSDSLGDLRDALLTISENPKLKDEVKRSQSHQLLKLYDDILKTNDVYAEILDSARKQTPELRKARIIEILERNTRLKPEPSAETK